MLKITILFFILPFSLLSQTTYYEKVFGTSGNDVSRSVKQLSSGSIYVLGNSDTLNGGDITLSKLDRNGNLLWTNYYGTPNMDNGFYVNLTSDGNLVFTGESETASNNLDVLIYKVDTAGAVIWNKTYATAVNETAKYIEQTADGGYILAGSQNDVFGFYDMLVLKLDGNGDYQWNQTFGRNNNDIADMVRQVNGTYVLTGDTRSYGAGGNDVMLYDLDSLGNEIWSHTYGDSLQNGCQGVFITSDTNLLSYGETEIYPSSAFNFYLQKIDLNGNSLWRYTYGGTGADAVFSVNEDADGGFVCTGYSNSYNGFNPLDLVIFKVDRFGSFLWEQTYGGPGIDIGYEIIKSVDDDGFIITGQTFSNNNDYYLLKLNNAGLISGISNYENQSGQLSNAFPNPANGAIFINYKLNDPAKKYTMTVRDVCGKMLQQKIVNASENVVKMDVSALSPGMYFYTLMMGDAAIATKKFIVN